MKLCLCSRETKIKIRKQIGVKKKTMCMDLVELIAKKGIYVIMKM